LKLDNEKVVVKMFVLYITRFNCGVDGMPSSVIDYIYNIHLHQHSEQLESNLNNNSSGIAIEKT